MMPAGHAALEVLILGRRVAAEPTIEALDPASGLPMADRMALATLALAVEAEAARRAGVVPLTAEALPLLSEALARIERSAVPTHPEPHRVAG